MSLIDTSKIDTPKINEEKRDETLREVENFYYDYNLTDDKAEKREISERIENEIISPIKGKMEEVEFFIKSMSDFFKDHPVKDLELSKYAQGEDFVIPLPSIGENIQIRLSPHLIDSDRYDFQLELDATEKVPMNFWYSPGQSIVQDLRSEIKNQPQYAADLINRFKDLNVVSLEHSLQCDLMAKLTGSKRSSLFLFDMHKARRDWLTEKSVSPLEPALREYSVEAEDITRKFNSGSPLDLYWVAGRINEVIFPLLEPKLEQMSEYLNIVADFFSKNPIENFNLKNTTYLDVYDFPLNDSDPNVVLSYRILDRQYDPREVWTPLDSLSFIFNPYSEKHFEISSFRCSTENFIYKIKEYLSDPARPEMIATMLEDFSNIDAELFSPEKARELIEYIKEISEVNDRIDIEMEIEALKEYKMNHINDVRDKLDRHLASYVDSTIRLSEDSRIQKVLNTVGIDMDISKLYSEFRTLNPKYNDIPSNIVVPDIICDNISESEKELLVDYILEDKYNKLKKE